MFFFTDDPVADAERYYAEQEREWEKRPKCSICDETIGDEYCYEINDELICQECLDENFRKCVDDCI